ncbi:MAG: ribosome silencing factor [Thermoanaerobaculia bacterium]|nr:ribosome silencing factor [Thermoanaerobaculia bacterium]
MDRKALDLRVLDLQGVTLLADYFLICHGSNPRQTKAIADAVEERLRARGVRALHIEGRDRAQWILLDFGVLVVHVFHEATRRFYGLEKLWADAEDVTEEMVPAASTES